MLKTQGKSSVQKEVFTFDGCANFDRWQTIGNKKQFWELNEKDQLVCDSNDSNIYQRIENLPDAIEIELVVSWENKFGFVFGLAAPKPMKDDGIEGKLVKIESWDESLVLVSGNNFQVIFDKVPGETKKLDLRVKYDRVKKTVSVHNKEGKQLATMSDVNFQEDCAPGVFVRNHQNALTIERLQIRSAKKSEVE